MNTPAPEGIAQRGYGTITALGFHTQSGKQAALAGLADLIRTAAGLPGFQDCCVLDTGPTQALMITLYASQEAAAQASASARPHLGAAVGPYVNGPQSAGLALWLSAARTASPASSDHPRFPESGWPGELGGLGWVGR